MFSAERTALGVWRHLTAPEFAGTVEIVLCLYRKDSRCRVRDCLGNAAEETLRLHVAAEGSVQPEVQGIQTKIRICESWALKNTSHWKKNFRFQPCLNVMITFRQHPFALCWDIWEGFFFLLRESW